MTSEVLKRPSARIRHFAMRCGLWSLALMLSAPACATWTSPRLSERGSIAVVVDGPEPLRKEAVDALAEALAVRNLALSLFGDVLPASPSRSRAATVDDADLALHIGLRPSDIPAGLALHFRLTSRAMPDLRSERHAVLGFPDSSSRAADNPASRSTDISHAVVDGAVSLVDSALLRHSRRDVLWPDVHRDALYFAMIDRFARPPETHVSVPPSADPDGWFGGTFDGLRVRLDWLVDLGVGDLWISPPFDTRDTPFMGHAPWHGYWTYDLGAVEPRFGTERGLVALAEATRAHGLGLWLDLVLNHVGPDAPLATTHPDWFHSPRPIRDWSDPADLTTGQVHGLPDFNQDIPEVDAYLRLATDHWLDRLTLRGLRLDAVRHIGTDYWRRFNGRLSRARPGLGRLAEILDGNPLVVERIAREGGFDAIFDFALHYALRDAFCGGAGAGPLGSALSVNLALDDAARARGERPLTRYAFLDNHDLPRIASLCDGDITRVGAALDALVTLPARPALNWGTEVGLMGAHEPDNRAPMRFDGTHPLVSRTRAALAFRAATPELRDGRLRIEAWDPRGALVFSRSDSPLGRATLIAINPTDGPITMELPPQWLLRTLEVPARAVIPWRTQRISSPSEVPVPVTLLVEGAPAGDVRIVGADPALGGWSPDLAPPLSTTLMLPPGRLYAMKLVTLEATHAPIWESRANRYLFVAGDRPVEMRLVWNGE